MNPNHRRAPPHRSAVFLSHPPRGEVVCAHRDASAHVGDPGTRPWRARKRIRRMSDESSSVRCWICLEDSPTCDGMISPCSCVGTNKWVHESCALARQHAAGLLAAALSAAHAHHRRAASLNLPLSLSIARAGLKSYCLQFLATNAANASTLNVACPICRTPYQITTRGSVVTGWRELLRWSATDRQLLLRHARFFFLAAPLIVSSALTWTWLVAYWEECALPASPTHARLASHARAHARATSHAMRAPRPRRRRCHCQRYHPPTTATATATAVDSCALPQPLS